VQRTGDSRQPSGQPYVLGVDPPGAVARVEIHGYRRINRAERANVPGKPSALTRKTRLASDKVLAGESNVIERRYSGPLCLEVPDVDPVIVATGEAS
jgi:hypothetical protein